MQEYYLTVKVQHSISKVFKVLLILCLILFANGWGHGLFNIQLLIDSPRAQGLIALIWYILVWICVVKSIVFSRLWIKITTWLLVVPALLIATLLGGFEAIEEVSKNSDPTLFFVTEERINAITKHVTYDYNVGPMCWGGLVERTEVRLVPGLLLTYGFTECHKHY